MPDGDVKSPETDQSMNPQSILAMLKGHASQSLQLAIDEQGADPKTVDVERLMKSYAEHVHERFAQSSTTLGFELSNARELGRREVQAEIVIARGEAHAIIERAKHAFAEPVTAASTREPMGRIERFTKATTSHLRKHIGLGVVAVMCMQRRGELERLDSRVTAVYFARALGAAAGDALAFHLGLAGLGDGPLVRAMREAFVDGYGESFGPLAEAATGRVN